MLRVGYPACSDHVVTCCSLDADADADALCFIMLYHVVVIASSTKAHLNFIDIFSLQTNTRFDAGLARSTMLKSVPMSNVENNVDINFTGLSQHAPKKQNKRSVFNSLAKSALSFVMIASTITAISSPPAYAAKAAAETVEHLHVGQKIANYFRSFGIPDLAVLAMISAMPVVELRGAVPVGVWMGLPITKILPVCVLGNMAPIIPLLFLLRNDKLK